MPPRSVENNYSNEEDFEQDITLENEYLDIERGDVHSAPSNQNNDDNIQTQSNNTTNPAQLTRNQQNQKKQVDVVEVVKSMISAGFTPTKAQIISATQHADGPIDNTNTFFRAFFQRLVLQKKNKDKKKK